MYARASAFIAILFLALHFGHGQKIVRKTLVNPESRAFQIDVANCYDVHLSTSNTQEIMVSATIDGEYQKDLVVGIEEDGSNVLVSTGFQPNFVNPNDKLSAHKVISIALEILLPEYVTANVFGTHANVTISGHYKELQVNLSDGDCRLQEVGENIAVKTQKGNIFLTIKAGEVEAQSKYGKVFGEPIPYGDSSFFLQSIEGDVHVKRTK